MNSTAPKVPWWISAPSLVLKFKDIPYHRNLEGYLADVFENIFSKEPCQATSAKQISATVKGTYRLCLYIELKGRNIVANLGFINCNGKI